jgi:predicted nucleic acid-binding protein
LTLCEVLVHPLQQGNNDLSERYRSLLTDSFHFHLISVDVAIAEKAADLRARYRLRTPDALQLATAFNAGSEAFLSNDRQLARATEMRVLILDDLELP